MSSVWRPMPLVPIAAAFDHPDWVFELKHDGFRALAHVEGHHCTLVSRKITASRRRMLRSIHSIRSAYTLGVDSSTVAGRVMITFRSGVGCHTSLTAWQTSRA